MRNQRNTQILTGDCFCTRLPCEIPLVPAIIQRVIECIFHGINGVVAYLDDILITVSSKEDHLKMLDEVLSRFDKAGLHMKQSKCSLKGESVTYLGHRSDACGHQECQSYQRSPQHLHWFLHSKSYLPSFGQDQTVVSSPVQL